MNIYITPDIDQDFKPTWLYIKQHNQTKLKYFGKTNKSDPFKYTGSGLRWLRHLKKHGNDVSTIWCHLFTNKENLINFALYFSKMNNIDKSTEWANIIPESGVGGVRTLEITEKIRATRKKNGTVKTNTLESSIKAVETRRRNGTYKNTPIAIAKCRETKKKNGTPTPNMTEKVICEHCLKSVGKFNYYKWHHNNCKMVKSLPKICCIYCHKEIVKNNFNIWHGENCRKFLKISNGPTV